MKKIVLAHILCTLASVVILVVGIFVPVIALIALGAFFLLIQFVIGIVLITSYNREVKYKNKVAQALALVDIHLKLRFDLVPKLVETVKGYAKHEKELFETIAKTRADAIKAKTEQEKLEYANKLVPLMGEVVAVAEGYPTIKADALFKNLMEELVEIEDKLVAARRIYDNNVNAYNTLLEIFPNNVIAKSFGFKHCELYKIDAAERIAQKVTF